MNRKWTKFLYEARNGEISAGVLLYKFRDGQYYVYLIHAGGPYNQGNPHAWGIPKGHFDETLDNTLQQAAEREFVEEVGIQVPGDLTFDLGQIKTASGKTVQAFAAEGDLPSGYILSSNMVDKMINGKMVTFPEVDDGKWFTLEDAYDIINNRQKPFITALEVEMSDKLSEELSVNEASNPKAIFMAGGPGSGKGTLLKRVGAYDTNFKVVNVDDIFEPLLKAKAIELKLPEKELMNLDHPERDIRSQQGKLFVQAQRETKEKLRELIGLNADIIIDGTGGAYKQIEKSKKMLEDVGYDVAMMFVDVDLPTTLDRNDKRLALGGRKVKPERVEKSWNAVHKHKEPYSRLFADNFLLYTGGEDRPEDEDSNITEKFQSFIN